MSKRKKKKYVNEEPSLALLVDNPETIAKSCAKYIGEVLDTNGLGFTRHHIYKGRILFLLRNSSRSYGSSAYDIERDKVYSVIPLHSSNIEGNPYWLAVSLIFSPDLARYRLEEVRLYVFRGSMSDREKETFFRAEWYIPAKDNRKHAQPHWHVYRTLQDAELIKEEMADFQSLATTKEVKDFGKDDTPLAQTVESPEEKEAPFEKFHFAMASSWHLNDQHQINFKTEQSLFNWLSRCISYIRQELNYVSIREGIV